MAFSQPAHELMLFEKRMAVGLEWAFGQAGWPQEYKDPLMFL